MTVWVTPHDEIAAVWSLPPVPLPLSEETAAMFGGRVEPAAVALDIDNWLRREDPAPNVVTVLGRYVATLAFIGATELLDRGRPAVAARLLEVGVRRAPEDPSLRANLGMALWDSGRRYDGLAQLVLATRLYSEVGQIAPVLSILTARALSEAGRHGDALELLEQVAVMRPDLPPLWDLIAEVDAREEAAGI